MASQYMQAELDGDEARLVRLLRSSGVSALHVGDLIAEFEVLPLSAEELAELQGQRQAILAAEEEPSLTLAELNDERGEWEMVELLRACEIPVTHVFALLEAGRLPLSWAELGERWEALGSPRA